MRHPVKRGTDVTGDAKLEETEGNHKERTEHIEDKFIELRKIRFVLSAFFVLLPKSFAVHVDWRFAHERARQIPDYRGTLIQSDTCLAGQPYARTSLTVFAVFILPTPNSPTGMPMICCAVSEMRDTGSPLPTT